MIRPSPRKDELAFRGLRIAYAAMVLAAATPLPAMAVDVASCGSEIPSGETGELLGDLACGAIGPAIVLANGATLNLNGFKIEGPGTGGNTGIACIGRRCVVNGPGEVAGFAVGIGATKATISSVVLRQNSEAGVTVKGGKLRLSEVVASENGIGVFVPGGRKLTGIDVEANFNELAGVWASGAHVKLVRLLASGNGQYGGLVLAKSRTTPRLIDSTVVDNAGLGDSYDIIAMRSGVKLIRSTCGRGARVRGEMETPTIVRALGCEND